MDKSVHNEIYRQFIALLKAKRIEKNVTQAQLATAIGVTQAVVSKIETCERRIDVIELKTICRCLDIPFVELAQEIDKL
jgi:transcriptional regulator with XRE-family HTH domain